MSRTGRICIPTRKMRLRQNPSASTPPGSSYAIVSSGDMRHTCATCIHFSRCVRPVCEAIGVNRHRLEKWCEFEHHGGSHGRLMKLRYLETWRAYTRVICFILHLRNNVRKRAAYFPIFQWNVGNKRGVEEGNKDSPLPCARDLPAKFRTLHTLDFYT